MRSYQTLFAYALPFPFPLPNHRRDIRVGSGRRLVVLDDDAALRPRQRFKINRGGRLLAEQLTEEFVEERLGIQGQVKTGKGELRIALGICLVEHLEDESDPMLHPELRLDLAEVFAAANPRGV